MKKNEVGEAHPISEDKKKMKKLSDSYLNECRDRALSADPTRQDSVCNDLRKRIYKLTNYIKVLHEQVEPASSIEDKNELDIENFKKIKELEAKLKERKKQEASSISEEDKKELDIEDFNFDSRAFELYKKGNHPAFQSLPPNERNDEKV